MYPTFFVATLPLNVLALVIINQRDLMSFRRSVTNTLTQIKTAIGEVIEFQSRIWIINIHEGTLNDESFVINEDNFEEPMQWMVKRKYSAEMIEKVDIMKRSQVIVLILNNVEHRLIRVK